MMLKFMVEVYLPNECKRISTLNTMVKITFREICLQYEFYRFSTVLGKAEKT